MEKSLHILLIISLLTSYGWSQEMKVTTSDGKIVLLHPNNTWEYEVSKADTAKVNEDVDCGSITELIVDKFTDTKTLTTRDFISVGTKEAGVDILITYYEKNKAGAVLFFLKERDCVDEGAQVNVLFEDGSRVTITSDADFNCDGKFSFYYIDKMRDGYGISKFRTKKVDAIRFRSSKATTDVEFESEDADLFIRSLNCVLKDY